ncbi:hypothetical protein [Streptomyces sp. NPDC001348]
MKIRRAVSVALASTLTLLGLAIFQPAAQAMPPVDPPEPGGTSPGTASVSDAPTPAHPTVRWIVSSINFNHIQDADGGFPMISRDGDEAGGINAGITIGGGQANPGAELYGEINLVVWTPNHKVRQKEMIYLGDSHCDSSYLWQEKNLNNSENCPKYVVTAERGGAGAQTNGSYGDTAYPLSQTALMVAHEGGTLADRSFGWDASGLNHNWVDLKVARGDEVQVQVRLVDKDWGFLGGGDDLICGGSWYTFTPVDDGTMLLPSVRYSGEDSASCTIQNYALKVSGYGT